MTWRPFQDFSQSRIRAELQDVRQDIEAGKELSSQFLQQFKPIVGCLTMVVATEYDVNRNLHVYGWQFEEAYAALEVLREEGCTCWNRLPETASWMRTVQAQLRSVIRSMPTTIQSVSESKQKQFLIDLRRLWSTVSEAERRITPVVQDRELC